MIRADAAFPELPPAGKPGLRLPPAARASRCRTDRSTRPMPARSIAGANAISVTPSDPSTDTVIIPGTGLAPSSRGSQSWADPAHPSCVAPGKRPRLTPNPAMLMQRGRGVMPFGTPGGDSQVQAMLQVLLNLTVFGMDPQTAIEQPRFITYSQPDSFAPHPSFPGRLCLEGRIPPRRERRWPALGHQVMTWPDWLWRAGGVCLVRSDQQRGVLEAGADPRRAAPTRWAGRLTRRWTG